MPGTKIVNSHQFECRGIDEHCGHPLTGENIEPVLVLIREDSSTEVLCRYFGDASAEDRLAYDYGCRAGDKGNRGYCRYHRG